MISGKIHIAAVLAEVLMRAVSGRVGIIRNGDRLVNLIGRGCAFLG